MTSHIQDVSRRLADAGWSATAPALFHRLGSPVFAYDDFDSVMPAMSKLTSDGIRTDLSAVFDHVERRGLTSSRCGIVGFCMGGTVALFGGTLRPLGASVTFYGGGVAEGRFGFPALRALAPALKSPWLGLYGDKDQSIPIEQVEELREAARTATVPTEVVRYPEAEHGFNCNDRPAVYNPEAAQDAWQRMLTWFEDHIKGP